MVRGRCTGGWRRPGATARPGWVESGSLRLASSPQRLEEIRRQAAWAQRAGLPLELISAEEAAELFPLMSTDGVLGAAYTPTDGQVDPARLCYALAASARAGGVTIAQRTRVTAITTDRGPGHAACAPTAGDWSSARSSSTAAACSPPRSPASPASGCRSCRCRTSTSSPSAFLPAGTGPLPSLRDPDLLVYYRQEVEGLVMGGYERAARP